MPPLVRIMIKWLVQKLNDCPQLAQGRSLAEMLSPAELEHYLTLKTDKRRSDWLLGRWTVKRLVLGTLNAGIDHLPMPLISVERSVSGAPYVICERLSSLSISISHSAGHALCALVEAANVALGIDIEFVQPRSPAFLKDFFTLQERSFIASVPDDVRDVAVNAIWSAKESVLKAFQVGLKVDSRCISCELEFFADFTEWMPFRIEFHDRTLLESDEIIQGWWRCDSGFVMTMAVGSAKDSISSP